MARSPKALPDSLAAAMADGASIDWQAIDADPTASDADLICQLRVIATMRGRARSTAPARGSWIRVLSTAVLAISVGLAVIKIAAAAIGATDALAHLDTARILPFTINLAIFGVGGVLLLFGGSRDHRAQLLGGLYLLIASSFAEPFLASTAATASFSTLLVMCRPEASIPLAIWMFAWAFPREPANHRARLIAATMIALSIVASLVVAGANIVRLQTVWPILEPRTAAVLAALNRHASASLFWPLLLLMALPALPYLVAKAGLETPERRRRVRWFLAALALGMTPMIVVVAATPMVPVLRHPSVTPFLGPCIYLSLASLVPMTAYAVAVSRVMTLAFVIRATLQYALARYAIWIGILAPLGYLALDVIANRGMTFVEYLAVRQPGGLLGLSTIGLMALTFRPQLLQAVDRWFHREPVDSSQALARLEHRFRGSEHLGGISAALGEEIAAALHAVRVRVLLLAENGRALVAVDGSVSPLPRASVLVDLLQSTRSEVHLDARSAVASLLPEQDQDWIDETQARLVAPLLGSTGTLLGVAAIGDSANGLAYTSRHVALVTTMCGHAALQLENRWLRQSRELPSAGAVAWQDEPAAVCPNCTETWRPDTRRCRCGHVTKSAVLPLFVNGKFRLRRMLGAGGTGVVYLATDLALDRHVALKTLPPMKREYAERLRREARAMAAVRHPNLATIYGAEEWHDTPLLVVEYLEGGTLHDSLGRGPLPVADALDLGIMLADVLDRVHGSGVLHRDIKPSNIGFTADGVPKLLDFGLAAMLDRSQHEDAVPARLPADELAARFRGMSSSATLTITHQVVGTPLYLSPEALAGAAPHESFDLWSLSLVLYEAIAGRHPFAGQSVPDVVSAIQHTAVPPLRAVRPDCPAAVSAFLAEALAPALARRPHSAAALRTGLRGLRSGL